MAGWTLVAVAGLVAGAAAVALVSTFKEKIGLPGLGGYLLVVGLFLGLVLAARVTVGLATAVGGEKVVKVSGLARPLASAALLFVATAFLATVAWVGYESIGPPEGYIVKRQRDAEDQRKRTAAELEVNRLARIESDRKAKAVADDAARKAVEEAERAAWSAADFVLVNPTHRAVAVKVDGDTLRVTARAADDAAQQRLQRLWAEKVPVVGNDPGLARRLYDAYPPGSPLAGSDRDAVNQLAGFRKLLPADTQLVTFQEVGGRKRVGHLLPNTDTDDAFVFCDLVPKPKGTGATADPKGLFAAERVDRERIVPGSEKKLTESELVAVSDLIDRWQYEVVGKLQTRPPGSASMRLRPVVYIDEVTIEKTLHDGQVQKLINKRRELQLEKARQFGNTVETEGSSTLYASGFGVWMSGFMEAMREAGKNQRAQARLGQMQRGFDEVIQELQREAEEVTALGEAARRLTRDLRQRFVAAGFPVLDRSDKAKAAFYDLTGQQWTRPDAAVAVSEQLVQATHLLLTEVNRPEAGGSYHLAMRLVDIHTSEILWTQHADFTDPNPPESLRRTDLAGTWRVRAGEPEFEIRITQTDRNTVTIELASQAALKSLTLTATRKGNKFQVNTCYQHYKEDPDKRFHTPRTTLELLDDGQLKLGIIRHVRRGGFDSEIGPEPFLFSRVGTTP